MSYTKAQQACCLSALVNILFKAKRPLAELEEIIQTGIQVILNDGGIQDLIGQWEVVWGPVVCSANSAKNQGNPVVPDHVCYVAKTNQFGSPTYAIAIAGTNSKSIRENICKHDLKVRPSGMVEWSSIVESQTPLGKIAKGTELGLSAILRRLIDPTKGNLENWVRDYPFEDNAEVMTLGHSLGAAISVALGVWLTDTRNVWGGASAKISCYPVAGPTVGDKAWTQHVEKQLAGNFFGVYNSLDAVPKAWDRINEVKNIYQPYGLTPKLMIKVGVKGLEKLVGNANPYQRCEGWTSFEGKFNPSATGKAPFLAQVLYQHLGAYVEPIGYGAFVELAWTLFARPNDGR